MHPHLCSTGFGAHSQRFQLRTLIRAVIPPEVAQRNVPSCDGWLLSGLDKTHWLSIVPANVD